MPTSNRERGDAFHRYAAQALAQATGLRFDLDVPLAIGTPPKLHVFDLATNDRAYVGESKEFTWTISGNVPSAKVTTLREAAQFLQALPGPAKKSIVMARSSHPHRHETLAEYFSRLNVHLLGAVGLVEICEETGAVKFLRGQLP